MAFSSFPLRRSWWDNWDYPTIIWDQHFGTGLLQSDLSAILRDHGYYLRPLNTRSAKESSGQSEVKNEKDRFQVMLDVSHFKPEEVKLKVVENEDNWVVIHGKHEEKDDEHGFIQREFTRRYMLPENVETETVKSSWISDGILTIEAQKKDLEAPTPNERVIEITTSSDQSKSKD